MALDRGVTPKAGLDDKFSYDAIVKALLDGLQGHQDSFKQYAVNFAYKGFSPRDVLHTVVDILKNGVGTYEDKIKSLTILLVFYLSRGPNVGKATDANSKGSLADLKVAVTLFNVKSKAPTASDITLPRLAMIFSQVTFQIFKAIKESIYSYPVEENEIGITNSIFLSLNCVPGMMQYSAISTSAPLGLMFTIHNIYQSYLSKKTDMKAENKNKKPIDYFISSTKYAKLASEGTLLAGSQVTFAQQLIETEYAYTVKSDILPSLKSFFGQGQILITDSVTQIHYILMYQKVKGGSLDQLLEENYSKSLHDVQASLPL